MCNNVNMHMKKSLGRGLRPPQPLLMCNVDPGKMQTQSIGICHPSPPQSEILRYHYLRSLCQHILGSELIRSQFWVGSGLWSTLAMVVWEAQIGQEAAWSWGNCTHCCNLSLPPTAISEHSSVLLVNFCISLKPFLSNKETPVWNYSHYMIRRILENIYILDGKSWTY